MGGKAIVRAVVSPMLPEFEVALWHSRKRMLRRLGSRGLSPKLLEWPCAQVTVCGNPHGKARLVAMRRQGRERGLHGRRRGEVGSGRRHVRHAQARGGAPVSSLPSSGEDYIGTLCARDYKGPGNQDIGEGKVIVQWDTSSDA